MTRRDKIHAKVLKAMQMLVARSDDLPELCMSRATSNCWLDRFTWFACISITFHTMAWAATVAPAFLFEFVDLWSFIPGMAMIWLLEV